MTWLKKSSVILFALILVFFQFGGNDHHASAQSLQNAVMISVQDQNGKDVIPLKAVSIKDGESAFDVIKEVAGNQLAYTVDPKYGPFITGIGGLTSTSPAYWGFFVNGGDPGVGSASYQVKNGDDLLFKIVNYPPKMINATVSIEGNGIDTKKYQKTASVVDGANAYDVIKQAYNQIDAPIDSQYFAYIANIDSLIKPGQYFGVYFNNQSVQVGVSSLKVKDGDSIVLKVTGTAADTGTSGDTGKSQTNDTATTPAPTISKDDLQQDINQASQYILKNGVDDAYEAMGLRQAGQHIPQSYIDQLAKELKDNNGQYRNVTDYDKLVLGITAAGGDASNFAGYNLIQSIYNNERMTNQGNNGPIYALIAIDSGHYKVPSTAKWTREKLVNYILDNQLKDGSWSLFGDTGSPDITGMALSALAPYKSNAKVTDAINKAVHYLSAQQNKNGGYGVDTNGGDSSESTAQVMIGLTTAGVDPTGQDFTKADGNLLTHLLTFRQKDGGFSHLLSDKQSNSMATPQALMALTAYQNFLNKKGSALQVNNSGMSVHPSASANGGVLPDTSTNDYNVMAFGFLIILIGCLVFIFNRKRRA